MTPFKASYWVKSNDSCINGSDKEFHFENEDYHRNQIIKETYIK